MLTQRLSSESVAVLGLSGIFCKSRLIDNIVVTPGEISVSAKSHRSFDDAEDMMALRAESLTAVTAAWLRVAAKFR
jgi:hypothetical protein